MSRSRGQILRWIGTGAVALAAIINLSTITSGQAPAPAQTPPAWQPVAPVAVSQETDGGRIRIIAGRSMVLSTDYDVRRMSITNPAVADARAVSPRELLID